MRVLTVDEKHSGWRIDKYLRDAFPGLPFGAMQKAFKKRDIKVNGTRVKQDHSVETGDKLEIYIVDDLLESIPADSPTASEKSLDVAYEDENILVVNKKQGVPVHPDRDQTSDTLIDLVRAYLGAVDGVPGTFLPSLCHRLDRNTGGLVIIAKNKAALDIIVEKMNSGDIKKYYQCLVKGEMENDGARLKAYLLKDEKRSRVYISDGKVPGSVGIVTIYKVLDYSPDIDASLLEVELITGRTHQIRAHLAHMGHPVLGDGKYGTNAVNRPLGMKKQALWAYRLVFGFREASILSYLKGREIRVEPEFPLFRTKHELRSE